MHQMDSGLNVDNMGENRGKENPQVSLCKEMEGLKEGHVLYMANLTTLIFGNWA